MFRKIILDAFFESPDSKDVSRMVVIINQHPVFRDYADFHKHQPEWWENLGNNVYDNSDHPKLALAPYCIAASQYMLDGKVEEKAIPLIGKAMAIDEEYSAVQTLGKACVGIKLGALEIPNLAEMRAELLPKINAGAKQLETLLTDID